MQITTLSIKHGILLARDETDALMARMPLTGRGVVPGPFSPWQLSQRTILALRAQGKTPTTIAKKLVIRDNQLTALDAEDQVIDALPLDGVLPTHPQAENAPMHLELLAMVADGFLAVDSIDGGELRVRRTNA